MIARCLRRAQPKCKLCYICSISVCHGSLRFLLVLLRLCAATVCCLLPGQAVLPVDCGGHVALPAGLLPAMVHADHPRPQRPCARPVRSRHCCVHRADVRCGLQAVPAHTQLELDHAPGVLAVAGAAVPLRVRCQHPVAKHFHQWRGRHGRHWRVAVHKVRMPGIAERLLALAAAMHLQMFLRNWVLGALVVGFGSKTASLSLSYAAVMTSPSCTSTFFCAKPGTTRLLSSCRLAAAICIKACDASLPDQTGSCCKSSSRWLQQCGSCFAGCRHPTSCRRMCSAE